jgi:hypothetical protein
MDRSFLRNLRVRDANIPRQVRRSFGRRREDEHPELGSGKQKHPVPLPASPSYRRRLRRVSRCPSKRSHILPWVCERGARCLCCQNSGFVQPLAQAKRQRRDARPEVTVSGLAYCSYGHPALPPYLPPFNASSKYFVSMYLDGSVSVFFGMPYWLRKSSTTLVPTGSISPRRK